VAFASIVATQLSQTLDLGRVEGGLSRSVLGAVAGSAGALIAALTVPPLRTFLGLATPTPVGWTLIGAGAVAAVGISRVFSSAGGADPGRPALPAPPHLRLLPPPREA
jgi:hypothetical protein